MKGAAIVSKIRHFTNLAWPFKTNILYIGLSISTIWQLNLGIDNHINLVQKANECSKENFKAYDFQIIFLQL